MVTHLELAMMSQQVQFKDGGFVVGWECKDFYTDPEGFAAGVYVNKSSNEMVIAFRGADTDNIDSFDIFLKNLKAHIQFYFGKAPKTYTNASHFVEKLRASRTKFDRLFNFFRAFSDNQLYLTGCATGASIATLVGLLSYINDKKNYRVVVFESMGIGQDIPENTLKIHEEHIKNYFLTYLADPSLLNTRFKQIGSIRRVHIKPYSSRLFSQGEYYIGHTIECVINDAFRFMLFLLLLNILINSIFGKRAVPELLSAVSNGLSSELQKRNYLATHDTTDPFNTLWFLFKSLAYIVFGKVLTKAFTATARQHSIDAMIRQLTKGHGEAAQYSEIVQWPSTAQYVRSQLWHGLKWLHPYRHPSLLSIKIPTQLHEKMIKETEGYKETRVVIRDFKRLAP